MQSTELNTMKKYLHSWYFLQYKLKMISHHNRVIASNSIYKQWHIYDSHKDNLHKWLSVVLLHQTIHKIYGVIS